jgi:hypothetical protein
VARVTRREFSIKPEVRAVSPSVFFLVLCSQQLELVFVYFGSLALFDITEH